VITLWLNPSCFRPALSGPPPPSVSAGPTRLVAGLFLVGGPLVPFSTPGCAYPPAKPWAGTITVTDPVSGDVVDSQDVDVGRRATFDLDPGTYTVTGTFANASSDDQPIAAIPVTITVADGTTVREDIIAGVP
jgi:hypothetical protein